MGCWAPRCCLARPRGKADQACSPQATRTGFLASSPHPQPAKPQAAGGLPSVLRGGPGRAGGCGFAHHPTCRAVVVAPDAGSGGAGVGGSPGLAPAACHRHRAHGRGVVQGPPHPAPWPAPRLRPGVGACCWGQRRRRGRRQHRAPTAPGQQRRGRAVRWSCRAWWCPAPPPLSLVPRQPPSPTAHGAASDGQGGARVGGGGRSPGAQGTRLGLQPPNQGLQATVNSLRSCLAAAVHRA